LAQQDPALTSLLDDLDSDLALLKTSWVKACSGIPFADDDSKPDVMGIVIEHHAQFLAIAPRSTTTVSRFLTLDCWPDEESQWALLRASALFASYNKKYVSKFVWFMGGRQLFHLKAKRKGESIALIPSIHVTLKSDASFIRKMMSEEDVSWEAPANQEELEQLNTDDD
jgi:hypothetical protein